MEDEESYLERPRINNNQTTLFTSDISTKPGDRYRNKSKEKRMQLLNSGEYDWINGNESISHPRDNMNLLGAISGQADFSKNQLVRAETILSEIDPAKSKAHPSKAICVTIVCYVANEFHPGKLWDVVHDATSTNYLTELIESYNANMNRVRTIFQYLQQEFGDCYD